MPEQDGPTEVWRVSPQGLTTGYALAGVTALAAAVRWLTLAVHPDLEHLTSAAEATAVALGFGLFSWWNLLRVRLELTPEVIIMVNPWGTQRLPWSRVCSVSLGAWGAQFYTHDGFKFTAHAFGNFGESRRQHDQRFAELERIVEARLRDAHPLQEFDPGFGLARLNHVSLAETQPPRLAHDRRRPLLLMSTGDVRRVQLERACWQDAYVVDLARIKAETVAYFRALDEGATLRHHFRHADEEGGLWYIEAVPDGGELIAVKQAELTSAGALYRYSWEHLEDEHGFLTDQAIDPDADPLETITAEEFQRLWSR